MGSHIDTLTRAFRAFPPENIANMLAWVEAGKPICCGRRASLFFDPTDGAG